MHEILVAIERRIGKFSVRWTLFAVSVWVFWAAVAGIMKNVLLVFGGEG